MATRPTPPPTDSPTFTSGGRPDGPDSVPRTGQGGQ